MAEQSKRLCAGTLTSSSTTLYTSPSGSGFYTIIKAITLCNTSGSLTYVTLLFNGIALLSGYGLFPNDTVTIPFMDQIINSNEQIAGSASAAGVINYYISGKEIA